MACSTVVHTYLRPLSNNSRNRTLSLTHPEYLSSSSLGSFRSQIFFPKLRIRGARIRSHGLASVVVSFQSNFFRVVQTVLKVGKDGVEAGTNLVPDSVPRPIAKVSVTVAAVVFSLFVLKSFVSTALFALGTMGFIYFMYLALNKDKGPTTDVSAKSADEAVEEAKKIMDKYK